MIVLFDTNVVLDVLLARTPHVAVAVELFAAVENRTIEGLLCATTLTTVHYLAARATSTRQARTHLETLMSLFGVAAVDADVLRAALPMPWPDFEDAVLHEAARLAGADAIVTRDQGGFARARLRVFTPAELAGWARLHGGGND